MNWGLIDRRSALVVKSGVKILATPYLTELD